MTLRQWFKGLLTKKPPERKRIVLGQALPGMAIRKIEGGWYDEDTGEFGIYEDQVILPGNIARDSKEHS